MKNKKYGWSGLCDSMRYLLWVLIFMLIHTHDQLSLARTGELPFGLGPLANVSEGFILNLVIINGHIILCIGAAWLLSSGGCLLLKIIGNAIIWIDQRWKANLKENSATGNEQEMVVKPPTPY